MDFLTSLFKPKEVKLPKTVTVEEAIVGRNGNTYFRIVKKTLTDEELSKLVQVHNMEDPPPFKNVTRRFANRRAKITYPIVYVTPERAAQLEAEKKVRQTENEAYAPTAKKNYENEQRFLKEIQKTKNVSLGQQLEQFKPSIGGKRKTRKSKRKGRKN